MGFEEIKPSGFENNNAGDGFLKTRSQEERDKFNTAFEGFIKEGSFSSEYQEVFSSLPLVKEAFSEFYFLNNGIGSTIENISRISPDIVRADISIIRLEKERDMFLGQGEEIKEDESKLLGQLEKLKENFEPSGEIKKYYTGYSAEGIDKYLESLDRKTGDDYFDKFVDALIDEFINYNGSKEEIKRKLGEFIDGEFLASNLGDLAQISESLRSFFDRKRILFENVLNYYQNINNEDCISDIKRALEKLEEFKIQCDRLHVALENLLDFSGKKFLNVKFGDQFNRETMEAFGDLSINISDHELRQYSEYFRNQPKDSVFEVKVQGFGSVGSDGELRCEQDDRSKVLLYGEIEGKLKKKR